MNHALLFPFTRTMLLAFFAALLALHGGNATAQQPNPDRFTISVSRTHLQEIFPEPGAPNKTVGEHFGILIVYADGKECASLDLASAAKARADVVLELGISSQPAACQKNGANISFAVKPSVAKGETRKLMTTYTLEKGKAVVLMAIQLNPPSTGNSTPLDHSDGASLGSFGLYIVLAGLTLGILALGWKLRKNLAADS